MGRDRQGAGGLELLCITAPTCCFHTVALIGAVIAKTAASQKPCERVNLACHAVHSTCQQLHAARWVGTFNSVSAARSCRASYPSQPYSHPMSSASLSTAAASVHSGGGVISGQGWWFSGRVLGQEWNSKHIKRQAAWPAQLANHFHSRSPTCEIVQPVVQAVADRVRVRGV